MIRKLFALLTIISTSCYPQLIQASAFGFEMGMSILISEENEATQENPGPGTYVLQAAPMSHPDFSSYAVLIGPAGLCQVIAESRLITTTTNGYDLQFEMSKIEDRITKKYGPPLITNKFDDKSKLAAPSFWMKSLLKGEREFEYRWTTDDRDMPDNIAAIFLKASAQDDRHGRMILEYQFTNFDKCTNETSVDEEVAEQEFENQHIILDDSISIDQPKLDITYY